MLSSGNANYLQTTEKSLLSTVQCGTKLEAKQHSKLNESAPVFRAITKVMSHIALILQLMEFHVPCTECPVLHNLIF